MSSSFLSIMYTLMQCLFLIYAFNFWLFEFDIYWLCLSGLTWVRQILFAGETRAMKYLLKNAHISQQKSCKSAETFLPVERISVQRVMQVIRVLLTKKNQHFVWKWTRKNMGSGVKWGKTLAPFSISYLFPVSSQTRSLLSTTSAPLSHISPFSLSFDMSWFR